MRVSEMLTKLHLLIKAHPYSTTMITVLLLATCLRFYDFNNHWGLGNDDSRDALIGREAIERRELPIIGSFSSAGPFVFGPIFYWVIMLSYLIMPFTYLAPWIFTGLISVLTVGILMHCGKLIGGRQLALIIGLLAATSPQLIARALSLGQHSYVALTASLLFLTLLLLWKTSKPIYGFLLGLSLGAALSFHYQTINLLIFFLAPLSVPHTKLTKKMLIFLYMLIGFLFPSIPIIYWESHQQFANTRNILDYILVAQHRIYVPNSWRLFLLQYFPNYWSFVVGGFKLNSLIIMLATSAVFTYQLVKKQLQPPLLFLSAIFLVLFTVNRYYKGERSEGYLLYLLPFILIFTGYTLHTLCNNNLVNRKAKISLKIIGAVLFCSTLVGNGLQYQKYLSYQSPVAGFEKSIDQLVKRYPNQKFSIYDYEWRYSYLSQPLSFLLQRRNLIDKNGLPIGFSCNHQCNQSIPEIQSFSGYPLLDLTKIDNIASDKNWVNVNQDSMYDDLMSWSKTRTLQSNFTLW